MRSLAHAAIVAMLAGGVACGEPHDFERGDPFASQPDPTRAEGLSASATGGEGHDAEDASEGTADPGSDAGTGESSTDDDAGSAGTFLPLDDGGDAEGGEAPQPADGWWSPCLSPAHCDAGLACLGTDDMTDGVCTAQCVPYGNAESCAPSPGGTSETTCLTVGGGSVCALDCSSGRSCPAGMQCLADHDDLGPIAICM